MNDPTVVALGVAAGLFTLGWFALLFRRNVLFMWIGVEIMLGAAGLAFVAAGARAQEPDGQAMFLVVLAIAAAEAAVGLAVILQVDRRHGSLDPDAVDQAPPRGPR